MVNVLLQKQDLSSKMASNLLGGVIKFEQDRKTAQFYPLQCFKKQQPYLPHSKRTGNPRPHSTSPPSRIRNDGHPPRTLPPSHPSHPPTLPPSHPPTLPPSHPPTLPPLNPSPLPLQSPPASARDMYRSHSDWPSATRPGKLFPPSSSCKFRYACSASTPIQWRFRTPSFVFLCEP